MLPTSVLEELIESAAKLRPPSLALEPVTRYLLRNVTTDSVLVEEHDH